LGEEGIHALLLSVFALGGSDIGLKFAEKVLPILPEKFFASLSLRLIARLSASVRKF
jgi:hypothetical protein